MTLGQRIKARREELGMSQEELAKKVGYSSRSTINKIELDKNQLRQSKIVDFATVLGVTPMWLMGWEDIDDVLPPLSENEQKTVATIEAIGRKLFPKEYEQIDLCDAIIDVLSIQTDQEYELISKFRNLDEIDKSKVIERIDTLLESPKYDEEHK